ncbi:surface lipoprotein assembly modifier [Parasphingorhabdus marina]|uniref:surface lipoprotein assembly modifier n=1 Tax=Parasphingorhabdus marina TaxID=394732 RepID=UPI00135632A1|nr:surface lipoprotein assembly modifier [Parasphingorhabdus marina]
MWNNLISGLHIVVVNWVLCCAEPVAAHNSPDAEVAADSLDRQTVNLSPGQLFAFAEAARIRQEFDAAEKAYRALASNPDLEIRTEARFRLALMLAAQSRETAAAVLLRQILDEKPHAVRVRLELASILIRLGDSAGADRELRKAQADGLPDNIARLVDIYATALRSLKPYGASIEIALVPDTNINRATRSSTLDTIIARFDLSEDARAKSGIGLSTRGQAYFRLPLSSQSNILFRVSGDGDFYQQSQFNDISLGVRVGPEIRSGKDQIRPSVGFSYRWFGGDPFVDSVSAAINFRHPMGPKAQSNLDLSISINNNRINDLQDGEVYAASVSYEQSLSAKLGIGFSAGGVRQSLRDPGFASTSGTINAYAYREIGRATVVGSVGYSRLEADRRLFLFPRRRVDNQYSASLSGSFRHLTFRGFVPIVRVSYELNESTVGIYDFDRFATEIGFTRAF